jgi:CheY-like chemotaxis protein
LSPVAGKRVLLAEDEFLIALAAADALRTLGADVVGPAFSLAEAIALVEHERLDGAVLDVNLAGEDSRAVADRLAAQGVSFVLASGYDRVDNPYAVPVVAKPYDLGMLAAALGRAFDRA